MTKREINNALPGQEIMPGCGPDWRGLAQMKADQPMKPGKPQESCDVGLFGDSMNQKSLF